MNQQHWIETHGIEIGEFPRLEGSLYIATAAGEVVTGYDKDEVLFHMARRLGVQPWEEFAGILL